MCDFGSDVFGARRDAFREHFNIEEHKHRFAAWAASRAASTRTARFSVEQGKHILEAIGINPELAHPDQLPSSPEMDTAHRQWRLKAIEAGHALGLRFTHGIAAKLINCYFKTRFCLRRLSRPSVGSNTPPPD